jgi:hypothetical protein
VLLVGDSTIDISQGTTIDPYSPLLIPLAARTIDNISTHIPDAATIGQSV